MSTPILLLFLFVFLFFIFLALFYLIYTTYIEPGAVYYPTTNETASEIVKQSGATKKDIILDLGSGDGRILIEFAKKGIPGIGYEIDPLLVLNSRKQIQQEGLDNLVKIHLKSFWHADFNKATIIVLYLFPHYMDRLQKVLEKSLTHNLILISNTYEFPRKKFYRKENKLLFYNFPEFWLLTISFCFSNIKLWKFPALGHLALRLFLF